MARPLLIFLSVVLLMTRISSAGNWYTDSFYLLHEDHHTLEAWEVGRDADPQQTAALIALSHPDVIQIHAKGNPGWTTYPSKIGFTPPALKRDVLGVWRDIARRDGYHWSIYYNIGRDGEIQRRRAEWNRSQADGKEVERSLCYHSGVAEEYLWPMLREIMAAYHPDGFWFDGSCFTVQACYCDKCRDRFKRESGLDAPATFAQPGWAKYQEMQRQIYREFVRDTIKQIHAIDPKCLVAVNWAYSIRMPEKPEEGIGYLTGDIANRVESLSPEAHWYDGQGLPFDLMTQLVTMYEQPGPDGTKAQRLTPKPRWQLEQEMAIIIANGGRYFLWDSPTPQSALVPEHMQSLGTVVAPFLRARQPWCANSTRIPDASLLHSAAAHYAATEQAIPSFAARNDRIDGAAAALAQAHLNYEMVPDWRLAQRDVRSPLLIVENPKALADDTITQLIDYTRSGGRLLMTGLAPTLDPRLRDALGLREASAPTAPEALKAMLAGEPRPLKHSLCRATPSTARVILDVTDSAGQTHPLLTENPLGQGIAMYAAIPLLSADNLNPMPPQLLAAVLDHAAPPAQRQVLTTAPQTVEAILRRQDSRHVLHLVNMARGDRRLLRFGERVWTTITQLPSAPPCHISVRLPARPTAVQLQPQNVPLADWRWENGRVEADVPAFDTHQIVVFEPR